MEIPHCKAQPLRRLVVVISVRGLLIPASQGALSPSAHHPGHQGVSVEPPPHPSTTTCPPKKPGQPQWHHRAAGVPQTSPAHSQSSWGQPAHWKGCTVTGALKFQVFKLHILYLSSHGLSWSCSTSDFPTKSPPECPTKHRQSREALVPITTPANYSLQVGFSRIAGLFQALSEPIHEFQSSKERAKPFHTCNFNGWGSSRATSSRVQVFKQLKTSNKK